MVKKTLKLAIPVLLESEPEIQAYLEAKERIEKLMAQLGHPAEVGVFSIMFPKHEKTELREAQLNNQQRYQLPLFHIQPPIVGEYALAPSIPGVEFESAQGKLESALTHAIEVVKVSPKSSVKPVLDIHTGVFMFPGEKRPNFYPGAFSIDSFLRYRVTLEQECMRRFQGLESIARSHGDVVLENEAVANYVGAQAYNGSNRLFYKPFGDPKLIKLISGGKTTFDSNHFAATVAVLNRLRMNNIRFGELFRLLGIQNAEEYAERMCKMGEYLNDSTRAIHLSNTQGIGVRLEGNERAAWGADGTNTGILSKEELRDILHHGYTHEVPVVIEVDYDIKRIPEKKFNEADSFLNYIFS